MATLFVTSILVARLILALDFTPINRVDIDDGIEFERVAFMDKDRRILLDLPSGWSARSARGGCLLTHKSMLRAEIFLGPCAVESLDFKNEKTAELLADSILASLPAGAMNAKVVEQVKAANRLRTFTTVVEYEMFKNGFKKAVTIGKEGDKLAVQMVFSAPDAHFPTVSGAAIGMLQSWRAIPLSDPVLKRPAKKVNSLPNTKPPEVPVVKQN